MKLTYDDKVQIYELRKQGYSLEKLSNKFGINNSNLRYMIKLIRKLISAIIECPICGRKTSDRPERCSHCGNKL